MEFNNYKKPEISEKVLSIKELETLSTFLSKIFKKNLFYQLKNKLSVEFLNWLYNENPNGRAIINNIYEKEKIIAHFGLVPINVLFNNKPYKSALTVFTAVDENHRGLHFIQLGNKSFELAKLMGVRFIIGVANQTSSELYVKCFKFKLISQLAVKVGLSTFQEENNFPHKFQILRDKKTLEWRLKNPRFKYQIYKENENSIIYNDIYKLFKINMGYFSNKALDFKKDSHVKKTYNLNPINVWIGLNNNLKNKKISFDFPNILKPSPLNLIIKDLNSEETNINKEDIKFNLIDYEMF